MGIPFYYNPATNELELTSDPSPLRDSLGKRFGLNEISTARNTLSPTNSYTEGGRIGFSQGTVPPGFITRTDLAKLLNIEPATIMSSKSRVKKGGHGQTLYKNITDILKVRQSSSHAPEFYSKPTKIQIAKILAGTGKEGQQVKRVLYKGEKTMVSVVKKLLENTSKALTRREIVEKIAGTAPVNIGNHPVKRGLDQILRDHPELKKKITSDAGTVKRMKFSPEKLGELANLIDEGKGMKELMKETGMSNASIYKFARLNNLKIIKTAPDQWESIKSLGRDITKLGKNKIITDALAGKTSLDPKLVKVADKIIGKGELYAARRLFNLAEFYTEGLSTPLKKNVNLSPNAALVEGATKLRNTSSFLFDSKANRTGYAFENYIYTTNAKKIDKVLNLEPGSFLKMQKTFSKALPPGFSPDEIFGVRSSGRLGTEANALFVQGIPSKINENDKRVVDALKSFAEKRLQDAGGNLTEQQKILTKYRASLLPYKKKYPNIEFPDFEIGKKGSPEKVIGPFERLPAKFKKLFKDQYKKFEYSPKVKKNVLTMFEALEKIKDPNFLTRMVQKAKMFPKNRIAVFPLIFGAGYLGLNAGDGSVEAAEPEIISTLETGDKTQEAGISATDVSKGALATAAGAVIAKYPGQVLKAADKLIAPLLLPLPNIAMQAASGDVDPTSAHTWLGPTFWKGAMESLNLTKDKWWHKALRAGMKPSTVAKVSGVSGPLLMATAAVDRGKAMSKTFKEAEELGIDVSEYVDRSSGVIEVTDDLYEEIRKRKSTQGMDYARGGIASLLK